MDEERPKKLQRLEGKKTPAFGKETQQVQPVQATTLKKLELETEIINSTQIQREPNHQKLIELKMLRDKGMQTEPLSMKTESKEIQVMLKPVSISSTT